MRFFVSIRIVLESMTVSSDSKGALTTLETLRRVRNELEGRTILGVSNISFGLPQREIINATFFAMALQNGLSAAIINPNSEAMMRSYYSFRTLADLDPQCSGYISVYSGQVATLGETVRPGTSSLASGVSGGDMPLSESIAKGLKDRAHGMQQGTRGKRALRLPAGICAGSEGNLIYCGQPGWIYCR